MHAQIVLFDGFDPLDVIAPYEVLHAGGTASGGAVSVELVSAEGPREVTSGVRGVSLRATAPLDPGRADLILVPGAAGRITESPDPDPGTSEQDPDSRTDEHDPEPGMGEHDPESGMGEHDPESGMGEQDSESGTGERDELIAVLLGRTLDTGLPALLKTAMDDPRVTVATVCGGSLVPAMAGLLEGRHATTHHQGLDLLDALGVHAVRARVVDDGDLVTGAGVTSGLDLGLYLLEREVGPRIAHAVEELFAHERRGTVWRAQGPAPAAL